MKTRLGTHLVALGTSLIVFLVTAQFSFGQYPPAMPRYQAPPTPSPLWVKVPGPAGMKVTFFQGPKAEPRTLVAPFTVGLRPGFVYRVAVTHIPGFPGLEMFPTLEVRGSLMSEGKFRANDFPAALVLNDDDFNAARNAAFVTKVVALERRELAKGVATTADNPQIINVPFENDAIKYATRESLPFLILRAGQRQVTPEELVAKSIPGTVWLPGDKTFPQPAVAPWLPWGCLSLYDPRLGPASLWNEICLPDGGDSGPKVGIDYLGRLRGFNPSDTVAEYTDSRGKRHIAVSNRVCICVPRYLIYRSEVNPQNQYVYKGTEKIHVALGKAETRLDVPVITQQQNTQIETVGSKTSLSSTESFKGTIIFGQVQGTDIRVGVEGTRGFSARCLTLKGELPDGPLCVVKWPDKSGAQIGDVITFTLKYTNQGGRPIRNVVISDNLVSRFGFVGDSARSDRPANFTTQPNDNGSLILRWEITDELPPGESGIVTFHVRVR